MKNSRSDQHDSLADKAKHWTLNKWNEECQTTDIELLADLIPAASLHHDPNHWKEKLLTLIKRLAAHNGLEGAGKMLSLEQLHEILYQASIKAGEIHPEKITSLLIGIPQPLFYGLIVRISPEQLDVLRQTAEGEAVQHHLSMLSHQIKEKFNALCSRILSGAKVLESLNFESLGLGDIKGIYESLDNIHYQAMEIIHIADTALALAWNTNRLDIIEELSQTKELCHKCLANSIGSPATEEHAATGLWETLEKGVNDLFSEKGSDGFVIHMQDTDPAIEALVKFSVWHLKDYCELGLLPFSKEIQKMGEAGHLQKQGQLFTQAEENLAKLGFKTLHDLKQNHIYSRQALLDYIASKR